MVDLQVNFGNKDLDKLYNQGKTRLKIDKSIIKKFLIMVQRLCHADSINDLRKPPSNRFEKLQGTDNLFSLRLNVQYRLEFTIDFEDREKTKGTVTVVNISKHYE